MRTDERRAGAIGTLFFRRNVFTLLVMTLVCFSRPGMADQTVIPSYDSARDTWFWDKLYPTGGRTLYCGQAFRSHEPLNIEHVFAASWAADALGCSSRSACRDHPTHGVRFNRFEADLHNLYPSLGGINSARGNTAFGKVAGEGRSLLGCDFEVDRVTDRTEPRTEVRGDIARAIFYIRTEYGFPIPFGMKDMLKEWHLNDPPSTTEIWRNDTIDRLQGTRNPYIDDPELAETL